MRLNIPDSADVVAPNQPNLGSTSDLKRQVETLNVKLASALKKYPLSVLTFLASVDIAVVLLWACIPLLTKPAPDSNYLDYWFFLGYYSFIYMLCTANLCYAALYIYTRNFCCNSLKDYYVCVASFTIANFVVGGVPGIAHELLRGKEGPHRNAALVWLRDLGSSKIYWPLLAVVGSLLYVIWCAIQCRKVVQKTSPSLNPPVPELHTDYPSKQEYRTKSGSVQNAMKKADQPITFRGYFSWIMVIVVILSTYYQGQLFSYLYFATAPHTFIVDVVSVSAFNVWISIGMKHIAAFIVSKYTGRPDIFHFVYTFTQFTSNVFYRNLILAKSLEGSSVIAVVNISGNMSRSSFHMH
ncbi:hypothetical protein BKA69DRAFT_1124571 [Paraphysoderma sedebokerense]|nr:hypothetical protein BKA69DRAFT_1124571 [Paraphysoderma sedebokerense]